MKEQLKEAWRTSHTITLFFLEQIPEEGLQASLSTRGGRTVFEQLVHLHKVRMQWMEIVSKEIFKRYLLEKDPVNQKELQRALQSSGAAIDAFIDQSWEKEGKVSGFRKGLIPFISYLMTHEAHHRGNILLTLKQSKIKIPDSLKWNIWEWNKI
ncbi:MAG: DinB family protein [Flavisolibacter sp.]